MNFGIQIFALLIANTRSVIRILIWRPSTAHAYIKNECKVAEFTDISIRKFLRSLVINIQYKKEVTT